jgi:hypothetical protein
MITPDGPDLAGDGLDGAGRRCGLREERTRRPQLRSGLGGPRLSRSSTPAYGLTGMLPRHSVEIQGWRQSAANP